MGHRNHRSSTIIVTETDNHEDAWPEVDMPYTLAHPAAVATRQVVSAAPPFGAWHFNFE